MPKWKHKQVPGRQPPLRIFFPFKATDYIEFYVGNAKQAAHYYKTAFGFSRSGYAGLETGLKDREHPTLSVRVKLH